MGERLGQHFLKNKPAVNKIIAALSIEEGDKIIEIGPGKGALTFLLAEECVKKNCELTAIEKDSELAKILGENGKLQNPNVKIINADALKILAKLINDLSFDISHLKLVGNIPYYITGKLLRIVGELKNKPAVTVLMIQKEVAERIAAIPPKMNILSAATQFWSKPEIIMRLKPADFDPHPEVDSAVIRLTTNSRELTANTEKYYKLIHIIFKQPRKTLVNNLKKGINMPKNELENALKTAGLPPNCRPQNLSLENIINLLCFFKDYIV